MAGVILVAPGSKEIKAALEAARQALNRGELVGIFPEGGMTPSGLLQSFRPGLMRVLEGTEVPVIPVYLDELWGSVFSYHGGQYSWQWPRDLAVPDFHPLWSSRAGPPGHSIACVERSKILERKPCNNDPQTMPFVTQQFIRSCKRQKRRAESGRFDGC